MNGKRGLRLVTSDSPPERNESAELLQALTAVRNVTTSPGSSHRPSSGPVKPPQSFSPTSWSIQPPSEFLGRDPLDGAVTGVYYARRSAAIGGGGPDDTDLCQRRLAPLVRLRVRSMELGLRGRLCRRGRVG